jgi:hypothetical protein
MAIQQVKRPKKVDFVSQQEIVEKNRQKREQVLRVLDELRSAKEVVAASTHR